MKMVNSDIILSKINARDGLFINSVYHDENLSLLVLTGEINGNLIDLSVEYQSFKLIFSNIVSYHCLDLDFSDIESEMISNFNIVNESDFIKNNNLISFNHYVLSSYDYVYQIIAKKFSFELTS